MVDLALIAYSFAGALCVAIAIVLVTNRATWLPIVGRIVSAISGDWRASLERARAQKARRERLYGYADITSSMAGAGEASAFRSGATGEATSADDLRRGQQHQVAADFDSENASDRESIILRQLARAELIAMLAVQRKDDGSYMWSSNEIKKFVPGSDGPIGEIVATIRGKKEGPPAGAPLRRPANGW